MGNKWFEDCNGDMVKVFGLVDPNTKDDPLIVWSIGVYYNTLCFKDNRNLK